MRECGTCNACCIYPSVPEIQKPAGESCRFLSVGCDGCQIYERRPPSCKRYACGWVEGSGRLGDQPEKIGVLIDRRETQFGLVLVARALRPGACEDRRSIKAMKCMSHELGMVCLVVSDDITDNQRVKRIVGAPGPLMKFKKAHPSVKIYKDRAKLRVVSQ
jgi:hypothetical protein